MSDTPRLDKLFDMVAEREGPCKTGEALSKWSYEAILDLTDFARTLERELAAAKAELTEYERTVADSATAAVLERAERAEAALELNRAILAGARNCILKYVPTSIDSDRDFTLSTIKVALERKEGA
jgi:hypothetical protein